MTEESELDEPLSQGVDRVLTKRSTLSVYGWCRTSGNNDWLSTRTCRPRGAPSLEQGPSKSTRRIKTFQNSKVDKDTGMQYYEIRDV